MSQPRPGSSSSSRSRANGAERGAERKRAGAKGEGESMPERKKARTEKKRTSTHPHHAASLTTESFRPLPIDERDDEMDPGDLPPPPSTVKIARLRDPDARARAIQSPAPQRGGAPLFASDSEDDDRPSTRVDSLFTPKAPQAVPHLLFRPIARPRPSAAPPPSPGVPPPPSEKRRARKSRLNENVFDSVVPLPITDTPVINKNRQLRHEVERRSSFGMRGQRASSSFGRGEPSVPHSSVSAAAFYKHIPVDQPEPIKARWLISWCAKRALEERLNASKGKQKSGPPDEVDKLLSDVVDSFVTNVAKGNVDTNVFGVPGAPTSTISVRPHPRNVDNRATLEKENTIIRRMRAEDRDWNRIAAKTNDLQAMTLDATSSRRLVCPPPDMKEAAEWFQQAMRLADEAATAKGKDIGTTGNFGEVEFRVDMLNQTAHQMHQYVHQSRRFLDGIFSSLTADLRAREGITEAIPADDAEDPDASLFLASAAGPSRTRADPMQTLRALAVADSKQQSAEAVARAAAVSVAPAVAARTQAQTPRRTGTSQTPRRASVYGKGTPRR